MSRWVASEFYINLVPTITGRAKGVEKKNECEYSGGVGEGGRSKRADRLACSILFVVFVPRGVE